VRILVVDDFEDSRDLIEAALMAAGYNDIVTAESASKALDILQFWRPDADVNFDVVLLDIAMPEIGGIETCARIRKEPRYADLPIIMLTALGDMDSVVDSFSAGATDYVVKPFNPVELVMRVQSVVKSKPKRGNASAPARRVVDGVASGHRIN
jgi:phosphoserine phosphatase RsbU/P